MKTRHVVLALALGFFSSTALATHCPTLMAKIDAILATNPNEPQSLLDEVKKLRAEGQKLHEEGKHDKSVDALNQALFLLGST